MSRTFEAFASCQPGLEPLVEGELARLQITGRRHKGGVGFDAGIETVMRAGLWLGCASHVLLRLAEFPCRALGELQRKAADLPWREWMRPDVPLALRATARESRVYHTSAIAERVTNAIGTALGAAPPSPPADTEARDLEAGDVDVARVAVRFRRDVCTISLDATATPLHRRGYRLASAKAPLREDLAHALLLAGELSAADAVFDPFCGSGTIAIEAAAILRRLAPGRLRPPPLLHLALFDHDAWAKVQSELPQAQQHAPIAASDRDAGAIEAARANAERAGVLDAIEFREAAFTAHPWLQPDGAPPRGLLATNPPFGKRIGAGKDLLHLYQSLGHRIGRLGSGWRTALLAHDLRLARRTGLELTAAFTTKHGGISVTALCSGGAAE